MDAAAAGQRPDLVATLVAAGMDIDGAAAGTGAYDFALSTARQRGHRRATRQLEATPSRPRPRRPYGPSSWRGPEAYWPAGWGRLTLASRPSARGCRQ
jgi:hypothetical protein